MNSSATGWRGPKAPDSQEPAHVLPAGASWRGAEGPPPASVAKCTTYETTENRQELGASASILFDYKASNGSKIRPQKNWAEKPIFDGH